MLVKYIQFLKVFVKIFLQTEFIDHHQTYWKGVLQHSADSQKDPCQERI